jgi:hypothetical protein
LKLSSCWGKSLIKEEDWVRLNKRSGFENLIWIWPSLYPFLILHSWLETNRAIANYKVFWRWCITLRTTGFLDFVYRPVF